MAEKMREEFEVWAIKDAASTGKTLSFERGGEWYLGKDHQAMNLGWAAWQASREILVIELPQIVAYEAGYDSLRENEYASQSGEFFDADEVFALCRRVEVLEAIEAAGLKVKP
jgi:hypothetical protein